MLETIFRTMLHRAFTGELTAKWREAHMNELLAEMEQQARVLRLNAADIHPPRQAEVLHFPEAELLEV